MQSPRTRKAFVAASALALVTGLSACGSDEPAATGEQTASATQEASPSAEPSPVAAIDTLSGVETTVNLDQGFTDALSTLGVSPGVVGAATLEGGAVSFPINGGNVTYYDPDSGVRPFVQGEIMHDGGLSLTAGDTTVELTDFVVDPAESVLTGTVTANGEEAATNANLFFLDGRTLEPLRVDDAAGTAVLEGTEVKLHPDAAALLRETFATQDIPDYLMVGIAEITLALPGGASESPTASPSESPSASGDATSSATPDSSTTGGTTTETPSAEATAEETPATGASTAEETPSS